jgi:glycosyltransferase involved in cell wall biosynthesis
MSLASPVVQVQLADLIRPELLPDIRLLRLLPDAFKRDVQALYVSLMYRKPKVIHTFLDSANIVGAVAGYLAGVPRIVMSARNVNPTHFEYLNLDWFLPWYRALVSLPSVHLTANSAAGRDSYAEWIGIPKEQVSVIPNAIDIAEYLGSQGEMEAGSRGTPALPKDSLVVLGVFRLSPEKRPLLFLRVMERVKALIPQLQVVIAGVGSMMEDVQTQIANCGMAEYTHVLGRRNDVPFLVKQSDMLCLLSENEGSPNVVMEAQALGKPVVCTSVGGTPEIVQDGVTGYLVPRDAEDQMVSRIVEVLSSKTLRDRMGIAAANRVGQEFSIISLVEKSLRVYGFDSTGGEPPSARTRQDKVLAAVNAR